MLREFWSKSPVRGVHPEDRLGLELDKCLAWAPEEAMRHQGLFANEEHLHDCIHTNLFPQPFIGNLDSSYVYILYGNPGFTVTDYIDEFRNPGHEAACSSNLCDGKQGFFPLLPQSSDTGVAKYWRSRLRKLIEELAEELKTTTACAVEIVRQRVSLIEAGAYHSRLFPGDWVDLLPSSCIARRYTREILLARAQRQEVLVFVWRRARFWDLPAGASGVLVRSPSTAQLSYVSQTERQKMVAFLAERVRGA